MSSNFSEQDKAKMTSSRFYAVPRLQASASIQKHAAGGLQKSFNHDGYGGIHFSMNPYPIQHHVNSVNRPHDVKMFSVSNQAVSVPIHYTTVGENMNGANVKQPVLGGLPVTAPHSVFPFVGVV